MVLFKLKKVGFLSFFEMTQNKGGQRVVVVEYIVVDVISVVLNYSSKMRMKVRNAANAMISNLVKVQEV